jgi:hypothetical protein
MGRRPNQALRSVWKQRIARQRRSRLSVAEFCREEGCSQQSFYAWRRRLLDIAPAPLRSSLFVPLELPVSPDCTRGSPGVAGRCGDDVARRSLRRSGQPDDVSERSKETSARRFKGYQLD